MIKGNVGLQGEHKGEKKKALKMPPSRVSRLKKKRKCGDEREHDQNAFQ